MKLKLKRHKIELKNKILISPKKKARCEAAITNNSVGTSVHIINQASVPHGFSSRVTTASENQKRRSPLQWVIDKTEIKTKD